MTTVVPEQITFSPATRYPYRVDATPLIIELRGSRFMADARLVVALDGDTVYDGGFVAGFRESFSVSPGSHVIETKLHMGFGMRCRRYEFTVEAGHQRQTARAMRARLAYSRLGGNFALKLDLGPIDSP